MLSSGWPMVGFGHLGHGHLGTTTIRLGTREVDFPAMALPELRPAPEVLGTGSLAEWSTSSGATALSLRGRIHLATKS